MDNSNKSLSTFSAVVSAVAAVALVALLLGVEDARLLWLALGGGIIGALLGFVAARSGANTANRVGQWLGIVTVAASVAVMLWLTPVATTTTTEVIEEVPAAA